MVTFLPGNKPEEPGKPGYTAIKYDFDDEFQKLEPVAEEESGAADMLPILIGAIAAVAAVVTVLIIIRKKRKGGSVNEEEKKS